MTPASNAGAILKVWVFERDWRRAVSKRNAIEATALALGAALLLVSAAAAAEIYRWVDAKGKVHYSDRPVADAQSVEVRVPESAESGGSTEPVDDEAAAVRAKHCALAQQRLKDYESSDGLVQEDEFGRRREIKGEERVQLIVRAQSDVKTFCSEAAQAASADTTQPAATTGEDLTQESSSAAQDEADTAPTY